MMKKLLTFLFLTALPLLLGGVTPQVFITPASPEAGEPFNIMVKLDTGGMIEVNKIPAVPGITISNRLNYREEQIQTINGRTVSYTLNGFSAVAEKPGRYTLPPFTITADNRTVQTRPLNFTVRKPVRLAQSADLSPEKPQLYMKIQPERELFTGETATAVLELILPRHIQLVGINDFRESGLGDALIVPQGREQAKVVLVKRRQLEKNGYRYEVMEFAFYFQPQQAGIFEPGCRISLQVAARNQYGFRQVRNVALSAAAGKLTVRSLPQAPADAVNTGLIGDWKLSFEQLPEKLSCGKIAELILDVSGTAQTEIFHAPELKIPQLRFYKPEIIRNPDGFTVKYPFVSLSTGDLKIDTGMAVFDPELRAYRIEKCTASSVIVPDENVPVPAALPPQVPENTDEENGENSISFYPREPGKKVHVPLFENVKWWSLTLVAGGVILAIVGGVRRYWRKPAGITPEMRQKLKALIKQLDSSGNAGKILHDHGFAEVAQALQLPPGATAAQIAEKTDDPELQDFFRTFDDNSFRPGSAAAESPAIREKLITWLKKLSVFVAVFALFPLAADFNAGLEAYNHADYPAAGNHFRNTLDESLPDAHSYFNIGCAEYMAGDYQDAALAFEQSYLLLPGDSGIKAAWDASKAQLPKPENGERSDRELSGLLASLRDTTRPDTYIFWASFGIFLLGAMIFAGKFPYRKTAMSVVAVLVIVALLAVWSQSCTSYSPDRARITAKQTTIHRAPLDDSSVTGSITGGSEVRIIGNKGNWTQIRYADGKTGWISGKDVKKVMPYGIW